MIRFPSSAALLVLMLPLMAGHDSIAEENSDSPEAPVLAVAAVIPNTDLPESDVQFPEDNLRRLFTLYMEARNANMFDEAEVLAKQIVEFSIESFGFLSIQTAHALTDLAQLQTSNADYHAAILNLVAAIEIIEQIDDRLSVSLLSPLRALGEAHHKSGNADLAMLSWDRAVHVSHVNLGPHNYDQVEMLASMSHVLTEAEKHKAARKMRRRIYQLSRRNIEESYLPDTTPVVDP